MSQLPPGLLSSIEGFVPSLKNQLPTLLFASLVGCTNSTEQRALSVLCIRSVSCDDRLDADLKYELECENARHEDAVQQALEQQANGVENEASTQRKGVRSSYGPYPQSGAFDLTARCQAGAEWFVSVTWYEVGFFMHRVQCKEKNCKLCKSQVELGELACLAALEVQPNSLALATLYIDDSWSALQKSACAFVSITKCQSTYIQSCALQARRLVNSKVFESAARSDCLLSYVVSLCRAVLQGFDSRALQASNAAKETADAAKKTACSEAARQAELAAEWARECDRACVGLKEHLGAELEAGLKEHLGADWSASLFDFRKVVGVLCKDAYALPESAHTLATGVLAEWLSAERRKKFQEFAVLSHSNTDFRSVVAYQPGLETEELMKAALPAGYCTEVIFATQTGSHMYDLSIARSDADFMVIYTARVEDLLGPCPPRTRIMDHSKDTAFGDDKCGVVEFKGVELADFLSFSHGVCSGYPAQVELLFTDKIKVKSWVWEELRERRRMFLTRKCARQFCFFIQDRIKRLSKEMKLVDDGGALSDAQVSRISKLLYHAHHRKYNLRRILRHEDPLPRLPSEEHEFVKSLRLAPPRTGAEARKLHQELESEWTDCQAQYGEVKDSLPQIDIYELLSWLRSVRLRSMAWQPIPTPIPALMQVDHETHDVSEPTFSRQCDVDELSMALVAYLQL